MTRYDKLLTFCPLNNWLKGHSVNFTLFTQVQFTPHREYYLVYGHIFKNTTYFSFSQRDDMSVSRTAAVPTQRVRTVTFRFKSPVNLERRMRWNACKGFFQDSLICNTSHQSHRERCMTAETGTSISTWVPATEMQPQLVASVKHNSLFSGFLFFDITRNSTVYHNHSIVLSLLSLLLYQKIFHMFDTLRLCLLKLHKAQRFSSEDLLTKYTVHQKCNYGMQ